MENRTKTLDAILAKLDKPPAAHNFARCNFQRKDRTRSALVSLASGFPTVSYQWTLQAIEITVADQRSDSEAIEILRRNCPPSQFEHNLELLNAFLDYHAIRKFEGIQVYPEFKGWFEVGPAVRVPVSPTVVIRENGGLKPLFVIGWATNGLSYYQRRFLTSIYEDAIYSLTDFQASEGEVLFFPRNGYGKRIADPWKRSTFEALSHEELVEQVERFAIAREEARPLIAERYQERERRKAMKIQPTTRRSPEAGDEKGLAKS